MKSHKESRNRAIMLSEKKKPSYTKQLPKVPKLPECSQDHCLLPRSPPPLPMLGVGIGFSGNRGIGDFSEKPRESAQGQRMIQFRAWETKQRLK